MFNQDIQKCRRCPLHRGVLNKVPGDGNHAAKIVLVGEAPGEHETETGKPFVGKAGYLLDEFLRKVSLRRSDTYVTNVLRCRPPENRTPLAAEVSACSGFLFKELKAIEPSVIICLGAVAANCLVGRKRYRTLDKAQGDAFRCFVTPTLVIPAVITWHPASFFRPHPQIRKDYLLRDLRAAKHIAEAAQGGKYWKDYKG